MVIDHIGIVVQRIEDGIKQWTSLFGYSQLTERVTNARQKVRVVFLVKKDSCMVKLIEPADENSPIYKFAKKGGGLHHICFKCDNIDAAVKHFRNLGMHVLAEPQPGEAFDNEKIAFIYAKQGLNIELIDTEKKAKLINTSQKEEPSP
jgi:methylmalonyl-CoA/ethylmalonyl-CoA epimerase